MKTLSLIRGFTWTKQILAVAFLVSCLGGTGWAAPCQNAEASAATDHFAAAKTQTPDRNRDSDEISPSYYQSNDNPFHAD